MQSDTGAIASLSFSHIGVVAKDIDKPAELLSSVWDYRPGQTMFGLQPRQTQEVSRRKDEVLTGEPFRYKWRWANVGPVAVDLLQPLDENSIYAQFLKSTGGGLHHIALEVSNWDEVVSQLQEQGSRMIAGATNEGLRFCYMDTGPAGIILELIEKR